MAHLYRATDKHLYRVTDNCGDYVGHMWLDAKGLRDAYAMGFTCELTCYTV